MQPIFKVYLEDAQLHFTEDELMLFGDFFSPPILDKYLKTLLKDNFSTYLFKHTVPRFEEEIPIPYIEIWNKHHQFIDNLAHISDQRAPEFIHAFFSQTRFKEFLIVLGQRITPASIETKAALPPPEIILIEQAFAPYNDEIKIAVRAWEKHVGRTTSGFWGEINGAPQQKEAHVQQLLQDLISNHSWWNVFEHFKHGNVYELREKNGHGLRWSISNNKFIGFVEPF
jgi:hypothetical protein